MLGGSWWGGGFWVGRILLWCDRTSPAREHRLSGNILLALASPRGRSHDKAVNVWLGQRGESSRARDDVILAQEWGHSKDISMAVWIHKISKILTMCARCSISVEITASLRLQRYRRRRGLQLFHEDSQTVEHVQSHHRNPRLVSTP